MSVDISDPNIPAAYSEVIGDAATDWLLIGYGDTNNRLSLYEAGSRGLEELRGHLEEEVLFGLLNVEGKILLLVYMPDNVSGVKRARALVHSRAVGNTFKAHHAVLTASRKSQVEEEDVREKLGLSLADLAKAAIHAKNTTNPDPMPPTPPPSAPRLSNTSAQHRSPTQESRELASAGKPPSSYDPRVDQRTSSDSRNSSFQLSTAFPANAQPTQNIPALQAPNVSTNSPNVVPSSLDAPTTPSDAGQSALLDDVAPPPPPKPDFVKQGSSGPAATAGNSRSNGLPYQPERDAEASSTMLPNAMYRGPPDSSRLAVREPEVLQPQRLNKDLRVAPQTEAQLQAAISRAKWEAEEHAESSPQQTPAPIRVDPAGYAEAERVKREKELRERGPLDAEERRRLELEKARRLEAEQRLKLEEARRAAEARRKVDEAERQATLERQRQEAELQRQFQLEQEVQRRRQAEDDKRLQRERWMSERANLEEKFRQLQVAGKVMLTGWASHQVGIIWRRRYFELRPDFLLLFKNAEETTRPVAAISTADIQEVEDARDELQLPHSLRVDFKGLDPAYFYCDSQEDKEVFAAALRQAARL
ncbi:hypothetical protein CALVIDRAFT_594378 [Calocera viscosa TUFC12733]|uniref:ADF-H domain-containing protein n=1 Tax=Calocera viscosa (strain TUFC12733) TaxID=1330018 RepID=A0A167S8S7_CALVF|nr:hypothetical protein CALVIDRAFT_594378 [Calocera viscosa TUFC12733]